MPLPNPVIFVPGITATHLRDMYPLPPDTVWALLTKDYDRVHLHPEDLRYEAQLPAQIRPDQVLEVAYREMVLDLRHDLSMKADRPVPVYIFGYDWRQPLEAVQAQLGVFIQEVIEKTNLMKHYRADGYAARGRVNLVGHSMGGLVITGYLADAGAAAKVERVATIATPYLGSLEVVAKLTTGTTNRREREASRLTPSLYYLLPSFTEGLRIDPPLPQSNMFDAQLWQGSIAESLKEAIRLHGSGDTKPTHENACALLDKLLDQARKHRQKIQSFKPAQAGIQPGGWVCFIGIGDMTRVGLRITATPKGPFFDLLSPELFDDELAPTARTGDGTVPLAGALPPFDARIQYFSRRDFRILELREKLLDAATALHGIMPNMDRLQSELRNHLA